MQIYDISNKLYTDGAFIRSICSSLKSAGHRALAKSLSREATVFNVLNKAWQAGAISLDISDETKLKVVYEKIDALSDALNSGMLGSTFLNKKVVNNLLEIMNTDVDPETLYLLLEPGFKRGRNLLVAANSTKLKKVIGNNYNTLGGVVLTSIFPGAEAKDLPMFRQLVSFNLFLTKSVDD